MGDSEAELLAEFGTPLALVPEAELDADTLTLARAAIERITFLVRFENGTELSVETDARDHRAYIRLRAGLKLPALDVTSALDAGYFYAFASWHAARYRHHQTALDWPAWEASVIGLDVVGDTAPLVPAPGRL
jgi:hypothetical protein